MSDVGKNKNIFPNQNEILPAPETAPPPLQPSSPEPQDSSLATTDALLRNAHSSLFDRLEPAMRRDLDRAIVERRPSSLRALYRVYKLDANNVSPSAFYRYAKRLRTRVALVDAAELSLPPDVDVTSRLPQLIAQQILEAMMLDGISPRALQRLADAYRTAAHTHVFMRANNSRFNPPKPNPEEQALKQAVVESLKARLAQLDNLCEAGEQSS